MTTQPPQNPPQGWPKGSAGKELRRTLSPNEPVMAWASGKGGALLVATDRRAIIIKTGPGATGTWFGRKNASFGYNQITSVDLHTGYADGYVEISAGGVQNRNLGRYAQLIHADNICPFNKWSETPFRHIVDVIRQHLYAPASNQTAADRTEAAKPPAALSIPEQIEQLAKLRDAGILSPTEFEAKKAEMLARM
jgi:hypothetical protein